MKKIISIIALVLAVMTVLTACQKVPVDNGNTDGTTTGSNTTTTPGGNTSNRIEYPMMDLFAAQLDQYIKLGDHKTISIELNVAVSDEDVLSTLKYELLQAAIEQKSYKMVTDRVTAKGDILDINFIGKIDGVAFEGGTANNQQISLSDNTGYIDGFDKDLYGIMPGTTVTTNVTFPENYGNKDYAGKAAVFEIKVNGIYDVELTDENIKTLTKDSYTSYETLKNDYRDEMIIENLNNYTANLYGKLLSELKEVSEVVLIPEAQLNYYYYDMTYYYEDYYIANKSLLQLYYGIESLDEYLAQMGLTYELIKDQAKLLALEDLLLISAAKKLECSITEDEYKAEVEKLAKTWEFVSADAMVKEYGDLYLKTYIIKEKVLAKMADEIQLTTDYDTYKHLLEKAES